VNASIINAAVGDGAAFYKNVMMIMNHHTNLMKNKSVTATALCVCEKGQITRSFPPTQIFFYTLGSHLYKNIAD
jgi:hypothetical protein